MTVKSKIIMLCDHPLSTSGVGTQARFLISGLVSTGKYSFKCFGGAVKHDNYDLVVVNEDFIIKPTNGFGDKNLMRQILVQEKPDAVMLFTDPRFFIWCWEQADEIHQVCPIVYNHLWDNPPWPEFNRVLYESTDLINCINHPTYEMVHARFPERTNYIPHAVPNDMYFKVAEPTVKQFKQQLLGADKADDFVALFVSRNARRKMPSDIIVSWKMFLDNLEKQHGHRKATLVMHTDPLDPEGPNLHHVIDMLHLHGNVVFSKDRVGFKEMNMLYNISDVVVSRSCFVAGTKVSTETGLRPIEDIKTGDMVMTHVGRFCPVLDTMIKPYTGVLKRLIVTNNDPIECTDEHPIWGIKREKLMVALRQIPGNRLGLIKDHVTKDLVERIAEFIPASQLKERDICVYAGRRQEELPPPVFDLTQHIANSDHANHEVIDDRIMLKGWGYPRQNNGTAFCAPSRITLTPSLAYVLGNWIADGTTHGFSVSFNVKDEQKMLMLESMLNETFNVGSRRRPAVRNCVIIDPINGSIIERFVNSVCGAYSKGKHVPEFIYTASSKVKRAFVDGLMAGDGCVLTHPVNKTKMSRYRTISSHLAMGLKDILISLGYCVSMSHDDNSHGYNKQGKIWCLEWRDRRGGYNGSCRSWNVENTYLLETVTKITSSHVTDVPVYNLEVQDDNTYRLQSLTVHNCNEGFGLSVLEAKMAEKPVIAIKTGGLTRQVEDHETGFQYGVAMEPEVRCLVGNQLVPYIYEDFVSHETVTKAFMTIYDWGPEKRSDVGKLAREHCLKHYSMDALIKEWDRTLTQTISGWKAGELPNNKRWSVAEL